MNEAEIERMVVRLVGDGSSYTSMMNQAVRDTQIGSDRLASSASMVEKAGHSMLNTWALAKFAVGAALGYMGYQGMAGAARMAAAAEQSQISFEVMLGNADKAKKMVADLRSFAAATPFETPELEAAAKTLLQFGVAGNNVMPMLKMIGDTSGGNSQRFQQMSLAFGQVAASGRLMGQDLLQMINAGFNPLQQMAKTTGKSMGQLKADMEHGKISVGMVAQAFQDATREGGQFFNMMQKQSTTFTGLTSTLKDNVTMSAMVIYEKIAKAFDFKGILARLVEFTGTFNDNIAENMDILISYVGGKWEAFKGLVRDVFGGIAGDVSSVVSYVVSIWMKGWSSAIGFVLNFRENVAIIWDWLSRNWYNVLKDMGNLLITIAGNMASNMGVLINTNVRLWTVFTGWLYRQFQRLFSFEVVDAILTGLIKAGEKIREWGEAAWETIKAIFSGKKAPGMLDAFVEQAKGDLQKGMQEDNLFKGFGDVLKDQAGKLKSPFEGFQSSLTDMPDLKLGVNGTDLPQFVWKKGNEAKTQFGNSVSGFAAPIMKEVAKLKGIDAVAYNSAEAVARLFEFRQMGRIGAAKLQPRDMHYREFKSEGWSPFQTGRPLESRETPIIDGLKTIADILRDQLKGTNKLTEVASADLG